MANNNHFELTLDTLAPTGSITRPGEFLKSNAELAITSASATYMKVWFDTFAESGKDSTGYQGAAWEAVATTKLTEFSTNGNYYYHMVLMDDVANESEVYHTEIITFDTVPVVVETAYMRDPDSKDTSLVNQLNGVEYGFTWSDAGACASAISAEISGTDIETINLPLELGTTSYEGILNFKAGTKDGTKTINIAITDQAGNVSTVKTCSITLDTNLAAPTLMLKNAEGATLPEWINFTAIKAQLVGTDEAITGYKIWEGDNEPSDFVTQSAGELNVTIDLALSDSDGAKTIHAKVRDQAGNIVDATSVVVNLDRVAPTVDLAAEKNGNNKAIISKVAGFDSNTLTLTAADDAAGLANYTLTCGDNTISSGVEVPATYTLKASDSMVEGNNVITLTVIDKAGNSKSATVNVILDTTAPEASIGALNPWYNAPFGIEVTYNDANTLASVEAWTSDVATDETVGANTVAAVISASPISIASANIGGTKAQSADNYMHIKVVDEVGNVTYSHAKFGYDSEAPAQPSITFSAAAYGSTSALVTIVYSDATSGVVEMNLAGDITEATGTDKWEAAATQKNVTLTAGDGTKNITVKVRDTAGNISEISAAASCELDTSQPSVTLALYEADGITTKAAISSLNTFTARITSADDNLGQCEYKIYGDFSTSDGGVAVTNTSASWITFAPEAGKTYVDVTGLYATSGDGSKNIYVVIRDNAGNESPLAQAAFELDTRAPEVVVSDVDHNRISKVHALRRSGLAELTTYADETKFKFTPDSIIKAYKVCAYKDAAAAIAGNPVVDEAIGTANGSIGMFADGLNQQTAINATIKGADFEEALGGAGNDGAHIVVVYIQDLAGTWSVAAEF